jgi:hypothetical protein
MDPATPGRLKGARKGPKTPKLTISTRVNTVSDDGWTPVGRSKAATPRTPGGTIKLSGNGGLGKLKVKPEGAYTPLAKAFTDFGLD